jgi:hypothetical protein
MGIAWRPLKGMTMNQMLEKCWELNVDVLHLFVDFQAAYYTAGRKEIWNETHKLGFKNQLNFAEFYRMKYVLRLKLVNSFPLNLKLTKFSRQGDAFASLLLNIMWEIAVKRSKVETREAYLRNVVK